MRVIPEGAGIGRDEIVDEGAAGLDRMLGHVRHAIHGIVDADAVPVNGRRLRQAVQQLGLEPLSLTHAQHRPRHGAVEAPDAGDLHTGWMQVGLAGSGLDAARRSGEALAGG